MSRLPEVGLGRLEDDDREVSAVSNDPDPAKRERARAALDVGAPHRQERSGHEGGPACLAFSHDGATLASGAGCSDSDTFRFSASARSTLATNPARSPPAARRSAVEGSFDGGGELIRLGRHRFSVNRQDLDLTLIPHDGRLCLHLTGTDYLEPIDDPSWSDAMYYAVECLDYAFAGETPEEKAEEKAAAPAGNFSDSLLADLDSFGQREDEERKAREEADAAKKKAEQQARADAERRAGLVRGAQQRPSIAPRRPFLQNINRRVEPDGDCPLVQQLARARIDKGAEGFTVQTPRAKVVDYGTEFGIDVNGMGSTDVVVFKGQVGVEYTSKGGERLAVLQRLRMGQGIRVDEVGTVSRIVAITSSSFPGRVRPQTPVRSSSAATRRR